MSAISENILLQQIINTTNTNFEENALAVFQFQYTNNPIYQNFCNILNKKPTTVKQVADIPFLPIQFFKNKIIKTTAFDEATIFESSGTTGSINSKHYIKNVQLYKDSFCKTFSQFYGQVNHYCIIGLLPSYLERSASSLVYMVDTLIKQTNHTNSGFYLYDFEKLRNVLLQNEQNQQPTLLIGVTYALLDFAEMQQLNLKYCTIMETGGMKGRREELTRPQVHDALKKNLGASVIHSEYGMTELLSQAYSAGNGIFYCPPYLRIFLRHEDDPLSLKKMIPNSTKLTGVVNIIDLINLYSCAFIATDDVGILYNDNGFEITGRLQNSDSRGCGLMII